MSRLGYLALLLGSCIGSDPCPAPTAAPPRAWLSVPRIGVELETPGDAVADGRDPATVRSALHPGCELMVGRVVPSSQDFNGAVGEAELAPGTEFKGWSRREQQGAGWLLEWSYVDREEGGALRYGVLRRLVAGEAAFHCIGHAATPEDAACISRACASLRVK